MAPYPVVYSSILPHLKHFKWRLTFTSHYGYHRWLKSKPKQKAQENTNPYQKMLNHFDLSVGWHSYYKLTLTLIFFPSTSMSWIKKSTPIVVGSFWSNTLEWNLFIRLDFPTELSPNTRTLKTKSKSAMFVVIGPVSPHSQTLAQPTQPSLSCQCSRKDGGPTKGKCCTMLPLKNT